MTGRRLLLCFALLAVGALAWWLGTTEENRLFALSAESGDVAWSAGLPSGTRVAGPPAVAGGRVVLGLAGNEPLAGGDDLWQMAAFDAATGRALWSYVPPPEQRRRLHTIDMVLAVPFATTERVYVRLEEPDGTSLLALDAATGQPAWTASNAAFGHNSRYTDMVAANGRALVPVREGDALTLRALRESDGTELWRVRLDQVDLPITDLGPFFAASTDTFYVGLGSGLVALDAESGTQKFWIPTPANERGGRDRPVRRAAVSGGPASRRSRRTIPRPARSVGATSSRSVPRPAPCGRSSPVTGCWPSSAPATPCARPGAAG